MTASLPHRLAGLLLALASGGAVAQGSASPASAPAASAAPIDAAPLPPAATRVPASAEECAVWQRERGFAAAVEAHDAAAFAGFVHPGAVFDAGRPEPDRGREAVVAAWAPIVAGRTIGLRWRPGIVQIGGAPDVALSRGTYVLQSERQGAMRWRAGFFVTVWVRERAGGAWQVLFDGADGEPLPMADRAAADAWVVAQPMSDCARP